MKWLKYLSVVLVIFLVSFMGLFLYIKTAFPPEKIKDITLAQLKKNFPKAQFKIKSIETSLFLSLNVEVNGLDVLGSEGKSLLKVEKVKSNVPLLSLLRESKAIDLSFYNPVINYRVNGEKNNFTETFVSKPIESKKLKNNNQQSDKKSIDKKVSDKKLIDKKVSDKKPIDKKVSDKKPIDKNISNKDDPNVLLPLLKNININISLFKMNFLLTEKGKKSKSVIIEKLSLRNIGLNKNIEINLVSKVFLKEKNSERNKDFLDLYLDGKISNKDLLTKRSIKANLTFSVLNFSNEHLKLSPFDGVINLVLNKEGNIKGTLVSKLNNEDFLESNFSIAKNSINLKLSKLRINLNKVLKKKDFGNVNIEDALVLLNGDLKIIKSNLYPDIKINNTAKINYIRDKSYKFKIKTDLTLNKKGLKFNSKVKGLDGTISLNSLASFDINKLIRDTKKIPFVKTKIIIDGLNIPRGLIIAKESNLSKSIKVTQQSKSSKRTKLSEQSKKVILESDNKVSDGKKERAVPVGLEEKKVANDINGNKIIRGKRGDKKFKNTSKKGFDLPPIPPSSLTLSVKKTRLLGNFLSSEGHFLTKKNLIAIKRFNLNYGKGKLKLTTLIKKKNNSLNSKYQITLDKFQAQDFKGLVPKKLGKIKGNLSIKSNGSFSLKTDSPFKESDIKKIFFESQGSNVEIEKLDINSFAQGYISKLDLFSKKGQKKYTFSSGLDKLQFKAFYSRSQLRLVNLLVFGDNKSFEINGKGYMYPFNEKKKGAINLNFIDNKTGFGKVLKNQIGTNSIPILLNTNKLSVSPSYGYTTKKVTSKFVRYQGQKKINKKKKEIKKKVDKQIKKIINKKNLKKLFKF